MNARPKMSRETEKYWVGKRNDSQFRWVFDKRMQHEDSRMVYLFNADTLRMSEHPKEFARSVLVTVRDADRSAAIAAYEEWHTHKGATFLKEDESRRRRAILERNAKEEAENLRRAVEEEERRQETIARHKAYLEKHGKKYAGVTESSMLHRVTHCYACMKHLDSDVSIECNTCGWLICSCGACGCGYKNDA